MKPGLLPLALWLGLLFAAGCARESRINTERAEAAFEIVTGTNRVVIDGVFADVRAGRHAEALEALRKLRRTYQLNPSQEIAVTELTTELEKRTGRAAPSH